MTAPSPNWVDRYLALLGVEHTAPSLEALRRLVRAQVLTVPFENSGSLLRRQAAGSGTVPPLDPEALLTAWEERRAGGVCFEHTEAFGLLLAELGYPVTPIAGEISFPGSHQALLVEAGGARWLLDVGDGSPFFEPIPLDRAFEVRRAGLGFRFKADPSDAGAWLLERALEGGWKPFCRFWLRPQSRADREVAYQRHHRPRETWVTNSMVLVRCHEDEVISFREFRLTRFASGGKVAGLVDEPGAWRQLPGLAGLPALPLSAAARAWAAINGRDVPTGA